MDKTKMVTIWGLDGIINKFLAQINGNGFCHCSPGYPKTHLLTKQSKIISLGDGQKFPQKVTLMRPPTAPNTAHYGASDSAETQFNQNQQGRLNHQNGAFLITFFALAQFI